MVSVVSLSEVEMSEWAGLIRALLKEQGFSAVQKARGTFLQFNVRCRGPFGAEIPSVVRVFLQPITESDISSAQALINLDGARCLVLVETSESGISSSIRGATYIGPTKLREALRASSFIALEKSRPKLSIPEISAARSWGSAFDMVAVPSLRWLPALSRNKKPTELRDSRISADRLFERTFFRVMTDVFQLRGESWGERHLFEAKPDGWLAWKNGGAIYDCKAAASGYKMNASDWRKFRDYATDDVQALRKRGEKISHVVVVSSDFPGATGKRHAVFKRASALYEECDVNLCYVRALDIAAIGKEIEVRSMSPDQRRGIEWGPALSELTTFDSLVAVLPGGSS